jgi:uncharacterized protein (TIGR02757 family)
MKAVYPDQKELEKFLEEKSQRYNNRYFIESDPIQIPWQFEDPEDIEISGFLAATLSWGQRLTIIKNMNRLLNIMEQKPADFIKNASKSDFQTFKQFKHRTFNGEDCTFFLRSLQNIYINHGGLKTLFENSYLAKGSIEEALKDFRTVFFEIPHPERTKKHVADISKGSSAKRLNMFLRWMVRKDAHSVDFGLWNRIRQQDLFIPLDLHSGNVARKLGLLKRKSNDWKAVVELTQTLRKFDPTDPVKYDFALFGLGVFEKF